MLSNPKRINGSVAPHWKWASFVVKPPDHSFRGDIMQKSPIKYSVVLSSDVSSRIIPFR